MMYETSSIMMANVSNTDIHAYYRGAIALNNIGVLILSRGHCGQAMEVFKDGIQLLRTAFHVQTQAQAQQQHEQRWCSQQQPEQHEAQITLQRAYLALDDLQQRQQCGAPPPLLPLNVLTFTDRFDGINQILQEPPTTSFAIRIDPVDHCCLNERDMDSDLAILMYNLAISNLSLATTFGLKNGGMQALDAYETALAVLQLAKSLLCIPAATNNYYDNNNGAAVGADDAAASGAEQQPLEPASLTLVVLVMSKMAQLLGNLGRQYEAERFHASVAILKNVVCVTTQMDQVAACNVAVAA